MRVIFRISSDPPPVLSGGEQWSLAFHEFVRHCLVKDPKVGLIRTCTVYQTQRTLSLSWR